jgi:AbrB family looped-hinge helix DNA binding protein
MKRTYAIQERGQVTLPREWREKYGLKKGDLVSFSVDEEGRLVVAPRTALAMEALDRIGKALEERGVSLEEMLDTIEQTRQEMYEEEHPTRKAKNA